MSRAAENILGVGLPLLLLAGFEWWASRFIAQEGVKYIESDLDPSYVGTVRRAVTKEDARVTKEEENETKEQNRFGVRVIAWSLVFTGLILLTLSFITTKGAMPTFIISIIVLLAAMIPFRKSKIVFLLFVLPTFSFAIPTSFVPYAKNCWFASATRTSEACVLNAPHHLFALQTRTIEAQSLNGQWAFRTDPSNVGEAQGWQKSEFSTQNSDFFCLPLLVDTENISALSHISYNLNFFTNLRHRV